MSVLLLAARFGQLKVIDMLWGKVAFDRASIKVSLTINFNVIRLSVILC